MIPKKPGEHVKTDRRDAIKLARLPRAGELDVVWVPDAAHEAMRDLVRARAAANNNLKASKQQLQSFLLRHGRIYGGESGPKASDRDAEAAEDRINALAYQLAVETLKWVGPQKRQQ